MMFGSIRRRTVVNADRTRGDASLSLGRYEGSAATTASIACSASVARPSARRQNARYCSMARAWPAGWSVARSLFRTASASS
jgi:hypothetical protein